jgi:hypothetical protein
LIVTGLRHGHRPSGARHSGGSRRHHAGPPRTVEHFEAAVEEPWSLTRMDNTARDMADQVVDFRLRADP